MVQITGTNGNDTLKGTISFDTIMGLDGADTLEGGFAADSLWGDAGNDTLRGSFQNDMLVGDEGNDFLYGDSGNDTFSGGIGADRMYGGSGQDRFTIYDYTEGKGDVIDGGSGNDTLVLYYYGYANALNLTIKDWIEATKLTGDISVRNVESFEIHGTALNDRITGGIGNDMLYGADGNDTLTGGNGNDQLNGGQGEDRLEGGAGNDTYVVNIADGGTTTIVDSGGTDLLDIRGLKGNFSAKAPDQVTTVGGISFKGVEDFRIHTADSFFFPGPDSAPTANRITTRDGADMISSGAGNDVVNSGGGRDYINAGTGADTVNAGGANDYVELEDGGKDRVDGGTGTDTVALWLTGTANRTFSVSGKTAKVDGAELKNFEIYEVHFSGGNDVVKSVGNAKSVTFYGGAGNDTLRGGSGADSLTGGEGNDLLIGGAGNDYLSDDAGKNRVDAGSGSDIINYTYVAGSSMDIDGGKGFDYAWLDLSGFTKAITFELKSTSKVVNAPVKVKGVESVTIYGGTGNDKLTGGANSDRLYGGDGKDVLKGLGGDDYIGVELGDKADGGAGIDTVEVRLYDETKNFSFKLSSNVKLSGGTEIKNFEQLDYTGSKGKDTVTGGDRADNLNGGAGDDVLKGGKGRDWLTDGEGKDKLYGEGSNDTFVRMDTGRSKDLFDGGSGTDTVSFLFSSEEYSVYVDLQNQKNNAGRAENLTLKSIENVEGSGIDDVLLGDGKANVLKGHHGDDVLNGRGGNDTLIGGAGDNTMTGGSGKDHFVFNAESREHVRYGYSEPYSAPEGDVITDFKRGEDKLVIDRGDFGFGSKVKAVTLVTGPDPKAKGSGPQFLFETDNGRLWFDEDGTGHQHGPELVATLTGVKTLSTGDFLFT